MRQSGVRVLQLSDENEPEINNEVRQTVYTHHAQKPEAIAKIGHKGNHNEQARIREEDESGFGKTFVLGLKKIVRMEVRDPVGTALFCLVSLSRDIGE